ncbi:MAG: sigma-70 family RNA polymerase sigma factor [Planctomycetota bacterium]|nr:MAG: sigma-70 family RNA polymerase sigma factor [Planctomycetota bacterium]
MSGRASARHRTPSPRSRRTNHESMSKPEPQRSSPTSAETAQRFAAADSEAFALVHERFNPGLESMFRRRSRGDRALCDDLTQQVWALVWRAVCERRYDPKRAAVSTFIYAVAHNIWRRHLQHESRGPSPAVERDGGSPSAAALLSQAELLDALRACLHQKDGSNALTDEERAILIGAAHGRSERALAAELNCAASTVHARRQSAIAKVRRCLKLKGFSPESVEQIAADLE